MKKMIRAKKTKINNLKKINNSGKTNTPMVFYGVIAFVVFFVLVYITSYTNLLSAEYKLIGGANILTPTIPVLPPLDKIAYDKKLIANANYPVSLATTTSTTTPIKKNPWPAKAVYPNAGALLPFNRIIAYYGNFYAKGMGVLGQYPEAEMLQRLDAEVKKWEVADPSTAVIPAIDYIAVTAQGSAGKDGKYRLRMPDDQIKKAIAVADKIHGIVILEIQPGLSNLQTEIPLLKEYLKLPQVHLALDPEFAMHNGIKPGRVIGTLDATDINYAAEYMAQIVKENNITPKVLIIHRFTHQMLTNYEQIKPLPEVQIILDMDGWGFAAKKINTYNLVAYSEPIQFTGFKLFYKNDLFAPSTRMLTPEDLLKLKPQPLFIQFQ